MLLKRKLILQFYPQRSYSCFRFNFIIIYHKRVDWVYHFIYKFCCSLAGFSEQKLVHSFLTHREYCRPQNCLYYWLLNKEKYVIYKDIKKNWTQKIKRSENQKICHVGIVSLPKISHVGIVSLPIYILWLRLRVVWTIFFGSIFKCCSWFILLTTVFCFYF